MKTETTEPWTWGLEEGKGNKRDGESRHRKKESTLAGMKIAVKSFIRSHSRLPNIKKSLLCWETEPQKALCREQKPELC